MWSDEAAMEPCHNFLAATKMVFFLYGTIEQQEKPINHHVLHTDTLAEGHGGPTQSYPLVLSTRGTDFQFRPSVKQALPGGGRHLQDNCTSLVTLVMTWN